MTKTTKQKKNTKLRLKEECYNLFKECIHDRNTRAGIGWNCLAISIGGVALSGVMIASSYIKPPVSENEQTNN